MAWRYEFCFLVAKTIFYSLAALVRKILFCHSKIKFIYSRHRVISSIYFWKRYPFSAEPPVQSHDRECPHGQYDLLIIRQPLMGSWHVAVIAFARGKMGGKKSVLKHYPAAVEAVLLEVQLSVIYFLLVNFPLFSLFCFCCAFLLSSTFFMYSIFQCTKRLAYVWRAPWIRQDCRESRSSILESYILKYFQFHAVVRACWLTGTYDHVIAH